MSISTRTRSKTKTKTGESEGEGQEKRGQPEVLSLKPRAFLYHNFLTKEECEHLITLAKPHMQRSKVADRLTVTGIESSGRTSTGMFLRKGADKVIEDIEKRISDYISIPVEHGERMQVLHYEVGQKFDAHYDYYRDGVNIKNRGQRMATFLMYLTDVEKGGETVFPKAEAYPESTPQTSKKKGISVKPKMGDALFFWSTLPDRETRDESSLHGSRPVVKGDKWLATKWMLVDEYKNRQSRHTSFN